MKNARVGVDAHIDPKTKFHKNLLQKTKLPHQGGITLIALIVNIIVLLILAGISLNLINGGNGIIVEAQWSEFVAEYTKLDEQKELYVAAKQMDKLSEEFSKADWRSLFTNISYAVDVPDTMYPVDLNQPFSIWDTADTLKATICYVEKMQYSDLLNKEKVDLYRVDMSLLPNVEVRREYVINIVSGMLYYMDGQEYKGKIYHTLKYGVPKDNPEIPTPQPDPETDLTIHYLSGFDDSENTQTVPFSSSNSATLDANTFTRNNYTFLYWKEIQLDASGTPQAGTYTGTIYNDNATGVYMNGKDLYLEAEWTSEPLNTITLDANLGFFDDPDVGMYAITPTIFYPLQTIEIHKQEGETFGGELALNLDIIQPNGSGGYQFEGWFTEKNGGDQKVIGDVYSASDLPDDTLYAHWEQGNPPRPSKDLTIHYLSRIPELDYSEPSYTQTVPATQTASATLDKCKFTGPGNGYTFLGWGKVYQNDASAPYQNGGYYDVANLLIKILDEDWEESIVDIIDSYEDWETDAGGEDDGEGVTDDEPEPTMEEERRAEIVDFFAGYETDIQNLFENSTMSLDGLADWLVAHQSYLVAIQAYENATGMSATSTIAVIDYYDEQSGVDMNGQDLWLEAIWTNEYVITLDANGGTIDGQARVPATIEAGDDYDSVIYDPDVRSDYTFEGWFTMPVGGTPFDTTTIFDPVTSPRTLYAHWVKDDDSDKIVEIIFDGNSGTMLDSDGNPVAVITKNKVIGSLFGTMPTPDRLGYIFEGWFTTPTGGNEVKSSDTVTGAMKLYAHWTESNFIKLDLQGGTLYKTGSKYWHKLLYNKWNPKKFYTSSGNQYAGITVKEGKKIGRQAEGGRSYVKGWQLPTAKNLYFNTSSSGASYRGIKRVEKAQKLNGKLYNKKEKFLGWYSKPNGANNGANLVKPTDDWHNSLLEPGDRTLYAAWEEALTITYDANGTNDAYFGKKAKKITKKQYYNKYEGQKYPKVGRPKRDGYRFLGWYDAPIGGNEILPNNKTCLMRRNAQTVYAQWEKMDFTINVYDVKENGWSHSYTPVNGDFSTCTIKYKWSTKPRGTKNVKVHTTKNTTITGRQPGKTFYVWAVAISKNKEKFYSNVEKVTLPYTPLAFTVNIEVSDVTKSGWQQKCTATQGKFSGYTVTYTIEEVNATGGTVSTETKTTSTPGTKMSITGKKEGNQGVKYKVWATATKGSDTVKSTNYVLVRTSHPKHYGDLKTGGLCYNNYGPCENPSYKYWYQSCYASAKGYKVVTNTRYCFVCGADCNNRLWTYHNTANVNNPSIGVECEVCLAYAMFRDPTSKPGNIFVCDLHKDGWDNRGNLYTTLDNKRVSYDQVRWQTGITDARGTISYATNKDSKSITHRNVYNLSCSGLVQASVSSANF